MTLGDKIGGHARQSIRDKRVEREKGCNIVIVSMFIAARVEQVTISSEINNLLGICKVLFNEDDISAQPFLSCKLFCTPQHLQVCTASSQQGGNQGHGAARRLHSEVSPIKRYGSTVAKFLTVHRNKKVV